MAQNAKLNPRQARVIQKIVKEGKPASVAYKEVYKSGQKTAEVNASKLLRKTKAMNALQKALRQAGIDEDSIAESLLEIKNTRHWRAKSDFVDKSSKFLGYNQDDNSDASKNITVNILNYTKDNR